MQIKFYEAKPTNAGPRQLSQYSDSPRAGRYGGDIFRILTDRPWGTPNLQYDEYRGFFFPGGKATQAWRWPSTPSSIEATERVELYLYIPSVPSWPVPGWTSRFKPDVVITYSHARSWERGRGLMRASLHWESITIINSNYCITMTLFL